MRTNLTSPRRLGSSMALAVACLGLSACQSLHGSYFSASELESFTALTPSQRVMDQVKLRWEARDDVAAFCAQAPGMNRERAYTTPPVACAIWNASTRECTVVTAKVTTHLALGHEVRHCFEGRFHP